MLKLEEVLQLKEKEDVRLVAKRHGMTLVPGLMISFLFIVAPFFFLFPLFSMGAVGAIGFMIIVLAGLILAWRAFVVWDGDALVVTTSRLINIHQAGIFSRTVNEIPLSSILEISWSKRGPIGHLFNIGSIRVLAGQELIVSSISRPKELHALVMELSERAKRNGVTDDYLREHRLSKIHRLLEHMDDRSLREVERLLERGDRLDGFVQPALPLQDIKPIAPNMIHAAHADSSSSFDAGGRMDPVQDSEIHIKTLFGEDRTTRLKLMDD